MLFILIQRTVENAMVQIAWRQGKRPRFIEHTTLFPFLIDIWR